MAKKKAKPKAQLDDASIEDAAADETFEESLEQLEVIVADLESGELGLDESLARYGQGVARLRRCHATLEQAERRIELLSGVDAEGNPITAPFDAEATADAGDRAGKRTAKKPKSGGVDDSSSLF
ncbi:MAG: exodeoxyribonuclease VII small subunit [Planctomycetota bacterium]